MLKFNKTAKRKYEALTENQIDDTLNSLDEFFYGAGSSTQMSEQSETFFRALMKALGKEFYTKDITNNTSTPEYRSSLLKLSETLVPKARVLDKVTPGIQQNFVNNNTGTTYKVTKDSVDIIPKADRNGNTKPTARDVYEGALIASCDLDMVDNQITIHCNDPYGKTLAQLSIDLINEMRGPDDQLIITNPIVTLNPEAEAAFNRYKATITATITPPANNSAVGFSAAGQPDSSATNVPGNASTPPPLAPNDIDAINAELAEASEMDMSDYEAYASDSSLVTGASDSSQSLDDINALLAEASDLTQDLSDYDDLNDTATPLTAIDFDEMQNELALADELPNVHVMAAEDESSPDTGTTVDYSQFDTPPGLREGASPAVVAAFTAVREQMSNPANRVPDTHNLGEHATQYDFELPEFLQAKGPSQQGLDIPEFLKNPISSTSTQALTTEGVTFNIAGREVKTTGTISYGEDSYPSQDGDDISLDVNLSDSTSGPLRDKASGSGPTGGTTPT